MAIYDLKPDEKLLIKSVNVKHNGDNGSYDDEAWLTNQNIVYITKGFWGNVKNIEIYPLEKIKFYGNEPQVKIKGSGEPYLEIVFEKGYITIDFCNESDKNCVDWVNSVYLTLTGCSSDLEYVEMNDIEKTINDFKQAFGFKTKNTIKRTEKKGIAASAAYNNSLVTAKCIGCRAPVNGVKGERIRCKYCDTEQNI